MLKLFNRFNSIKTVLLVLAIFPALVFADDNALTKYQNMIDQANRTPAQNNPQTAQAITSNGQAALMPVNPAAVPPPTALSPVTPAVAPTTTAPSAETPAQQPAQQQQTAPANTGPPNIFATPGSNATTSGSQSNSVIHY
jgi:hypothetical protein